MPAHLSLPITRRALVVALAGTSLAAPALASDSERTAFDARPGKAAAAPGQATQALKRALGAQGLVSTDRHTGTVRAAARLDGTLTGRSDRAGAEIALGYLREHGRALGLPGGVAPGLALEDRAVNGRMEILTWRQRHRGIPSADTFLRAALDEEGRLLSLTGAPAAELEPPTTAPALTAAQALRVVTGLPAPAGGRTDGGPERATTFTGGARASLVLYQGDGGTRLAWRVLAPLGDDELADALVDAADGTVVKRANRVKFATAKVFEGSPDDPAGQITVPLDPWGTAAAKLQGDRVHAFADPADEVKPGGALTPTLETSDWDNGLIEYPGCGGTRCTWQPGNRLANRDQSATQLYYFVNTFLDHLAASPIGFTDATGGYGPGDRIVAQAMDGASGSTERNNASFVAYEDGAPGLLEVHLFDAFGNYLDGANDAALVFHEVTHGLSERLVTDAQGFGALSSAQGGAIGEGTSDFYALDYLVERGLQAPTDVRFGAYLGGWTRDWPIDGDQLGYGPLEGQEHADGEIWAQTLWDLREALTPAVARAVITDGLRLAPPEPSFLDMRNAILAASGDATDEAIWDVFADRGMGYLASTDGADDLAPEPDESRPAELGTADKLLTGVVEDEDGVRVAGAHVGIAGHDTDGLGAQLTDETDGEGRFEIRGYAGTHPLMRVRKAGHAERREPDVTFPGTRHVVLPRDWASTARGASVEAFTGPDNTAVGCGPGGLIDDSSTTVWGTTVGGQSIVVDLGAPVDVAAVEIDPGAGCGDDDTAALGQAELQVATGPSGFSALGPALAFDEADIGRMTPAFSGTREAVRYVRLVATAPQGSEPDTSGEQFVDVAELQVVKTSGSALGPTADTGPATAVGPSGATLTGTVAPNGGAAPQVIFEYGTSTAYGSVVAAGGSPAVSAAITGLAPSTRYHFRVVALRDGRRYEGANASFVTAASGPAAPPPVQQLVTSKVRSRKLVADRRGRFPLKVRFGSDAPKGTARIAVVARRTTIAKAKLRVRRGQTRRVVLKLNAAGRRAIRPGKSRRVRVVVRLPGGEKFARTVRLSRKR